MLSRKDYNNTMRLLGVPMVLHQVKPPNAVINLPFAGIATPRKDIEVINNYGVGSKVITILESDTGSTIPEKFDYVIVGSGGEKLVFEAVVKVHEPATGVVIGYRCYVRGK